MMRPSRWFLLILLGIPLVACAVQADLPAEPPQGLGSAWFHDDCAPWDGSATTLLLGKEVASSPSSQAFPTFKSLCIRTGANSEQQGDSA